MVGGKVVAWVSIMVQLRRLSSANPVSKFFKVFRQATSRTVDRSRPEERLAPYAAPGARAWVLLIISALGKP